MSRHLKNKTYLCVCALHKKKCSSSCWFVDYVAEYVTSASSKIITSLYGGLLIYLYLLLGRFISPARPMDIKSGCVKDDLEQYIICIHADVKYEKSMPAGKGSNADFDTTLCKTHLAGEKFAQITYTSFIYKRNNFAIFVLNT